MYASRKICTISDPHSEIISRIVLDEHWRLNQASLAAKFSNAARCFDFTKQNTVRGNIWKEDVINDSAAILKNQVPLILE
jgi:hypothetical protein